VLDFTSALYLGFWHGSCELRPWAQFTTGRPGALGSPELASVVCRELAALQGCERATLASSTLHVFWDLFPMIAETGAAIFLDDGTYPIARWGVERAAALGIPVRTFQHYNARSLLEAFVTADGGRRPVIVSDGFCPACGRCAPVGEYLVLARQYGGYVVLDDTQALGILGHSASREAPYGEGGGGVLQLTNLGGPEVVLVSSMAKAFGVPMAVLSGPADLVERYESESETRMHCSPPSIAALSAAEDALQLNREFGDGLRLRLVHLVQFFRDRMEEMGLDSIGRLFPVQTLSALRSVDAFDLHTKLLQRGVRGVLHRVRHGRTPAISFLITARHTFHELEWAAGTLSGILRSSVRPSSSSR